MITFLNKFKWI